MPFNSVEMVAQLRLFHGIAHSLVAASLPPLFDFRLKPDAIKTYSDGTLVFGRDHDGSSRTGAFNRACFFRG